MADLKPLPSWDGEATWATFETGLFHGLIGDTEIQKCADDLLRYEELIETTQPDVVIETGTRAGGSALWFKQQGLRVITIDIGPQWLTRGTPPDTSGQIDWVIGSSIASRTIREIESILTDLDGARVMVSLDSDHHRAHVAEEIETWAAFVSNGCYLVIEDACFDVWVPERARVGGARIPEEGGALPAINEQANLLNRHGFRRDEALEGLTAVSHSPVGWWRKDI